MKKPLLMAVALVALGGCGGELDELKQFVRESDKGLPRKIEPLPAVKPFEPFTYEGFDLPDPFKPRKLSSAPCAQPPCGGPAPDLNRRKEPLEAFPDRKSTRLNSSHTVISYAVFCLKKKKKNYEDHSTLRIQ